MPNNPKFIGVVKVVQATVTSSTPVAEVFDTSGEHKVIRAVLYSATTVSSGRSLGLHINTYAATPAAGAETPTCGRELTGVGSLVGSMADALPMVKNADGGALGVPVNKTYGLWLEGFSLAAGDSVSVTVIYTEE